MSKVLLESVNIKLFHVNWVADKVAQSPDGETIDNANHQLESCGEILGTLAVFEDRTLLPWWSIYQRRAPNPGSTIPVIGLMTTNIITLNFERFNQLIQCNRFIFY